MLVSVRKIIHLSWPLQAFCNCPLRRATTLRLLSSSCFVAPSDQLRQSAYWRSSLWHWLPRSTAAGRYATVTAYCRLWREIWIGESRWVVIHSVPVNWPLSLRPLQIRWQWTGHNSVELTGSLQWPGQACSHVKRESQGRQGSALLLVSMGLPVSLSHLGRPNSRLPAVVAKAEEEEGGAPGAETATVTVAEAAATVCVPTEPILKHITSNYCCWATTEKFENGRIWGEILRQHKSPSLSSLQYLLNFDLLKQYCKTQCEVFVKE